MKTSYFLSFYFLSFMVVTFVLAIFSCSDSTDADFSAPYDSSSPKIVETSDSLEAKGLITPFTGDRKQLQKGTVTRTAHDNDLDEELRQLEEVPIFLQVQGNTSHHQFLSATEKGKELFMSTLNDAHDNQKFYLKILPAVSGIPYLIYSKQTGTPIRIGSYTNQPKVKVLYASNDNKGNLFGASWDIKRAKYSSEAYIIENEDFPEQNGSNPWWGVYYNVITANGVKIIFERYKQSPKQEFKIIPAEKFRIESIRFNIDATATLAKNPDLLFSDRFTNNGPIEQKHTFSISSTYKETSNFVKKTSYSLSLSVEASVKVPFVTGGKITTSTSFGKEFTYGKSEEHSTTINREYPILVPAKYTARMNLTLYKYNMDVEYIATCIGLTSGKRINIKGRWQGVDVQETDAVLDLTPINGNKGEAKKITITKSMLNSKRTIKVM